MKERPEGFASAKKHVCIQTFGTVELASGRFWNVTLERLARLEGVMLDEIDELKKLVNGK